MLLYLIVVFKEVKYCNIPKQELLMLRVVKGFVEILVDEWCRIFFNYENEFVND